MPRSLAVPYPKKGIYHCGCATPPHEKKELKILSHCNFKTSMMGVFDVLIVLMKICLIKS